MNKTSIPWVLDPDDKPGYTWNPAIGCKAISPGCAHCYAARLAGTRLAHLPQYAGLVSRKREVETVVHSRNSATLKLVESVGHWTGEVRFFPEKLAEPLRLRKPAGIFVMDMGDIALLDDDQFDTVFGVMAACQYLGRDGGPGHRFYVLTKRPAILRARLSVDRRQRWARSATMHGGGYDPDGIHDQVAMGPQVLPHVWIGASVCTQDEAEKNIPDLLQTPAAVRFLSMEPLLEEVDISDWMANQDAEQDTTSHAIWRGDARGIDWVIVGGESGPKARPYRPEWPAEIISQCNDAGVPVFHKQVGSNCITRNDDNFTAGEGDPDFPGWPDHLIAEGRVQDVNPVNRYQGADVRIRTRDRAGADPSEWREGLRVRQLPTVKR